ncbi:MAG: aminopeptidase P family protein, partial [Verrucomicrobia bacterium]|nr:aminopeptidase P family protein [Verrucomicrobiota bacterium]
VMSDLEIDRASREAPHCRALSWAHYANKLKKSGARNVTHAQVINLILRERGLRSIHVSEKFPLGLAGQLRGLGISVRLHKGPCFPEREIKCAHEVKKISAAMLMAEVGLAEALHALKHSKVGRGGRLMYHNAPLTSEKLRSVIDTAIIQAGGLAAHTIVAGGSQACDPHERGHGQLRANEPIIVDVFPRSQKTGYFGDITRTFVKGRASEAVRKLYHTVALGQALAFKQLRVGARGRDVHQSVKEFFERQGYRTGRQNGHMEGFFHGTGHGLGMDIHESPRVGPNSRDTLRRGQVVTVEPGLYYPGIGGVRLEDVAFVTANGARNLTKFEKVLEV